MNWVRRMIWVDIIFKKIVIEILISLLLVHEIIFSFLE